MSARPPDDLVDLCPGEIRRSRLDDEGYVAADVDCVHCGYNLRTLHRDSRCPECNQPVSDAFRTGELTYAPASHIRRLRRGALSLAVAFAIAAAIATLILVAECGDWPTASPLRKFAFAIWRPQTLYVLTATASVCFTLGTCWLTAREPGVHQGFADRGTRLFLRASGIGFACLLLLNGPSPGLISLAAFVSLIGLPVLYSHASILARRLGCRAVERRGSVAIVLHFVAAFALVAIAGVAQRPHLERELFIGLVNMLVIVYAVLVVLLFWRLAQALGRLPAVRPRP